MDEEPVPLSSRRQFAAHLAGAAAAAILPKSLFAANKTFGHTLVIDCNTSPPVSAGGVIPQNDLHLIRASGVTVCKTTIGGFNASFEQTVSDIAFWQRIIELYPGHFLQVRTHADIGRAHRDHKLGIIFSFEAATMFDSRTDRINLFRNLGVLVMQLSYNLAGPFGSGVMAAGGLTDLGREAIARMNDNGVALDLSHSNEATSLAALAATKKTPILSHGGCAAVHSHPRNKSDKLLRAAAARGAVFGIYMLPYLAASPKQATLDDYLNHMTHALAVMGEDHVGIGTDVAMRPFDTTPKAMAGFRKEVEERRTAGVAAPEEDRPPYLADANVPRKLERVADGLAKRGYSAAAVDKVLGLNFRRALREAWAD